jgi:hypothetical protein
MMGTKRPPVETVSRNGDSVEIRSYDNHGKLQYQFQVGRGKDRKIITKRSLATLRHLGVNDFSQCLKALTLMEQVGILEVKECRLAKPGEEKGFMITLPWLVNKEGEDERE